MGGRQEPERRLVTPAALLAALREAVAATCQSSGCSKPGCSLPVARSLRPFVSVDLDAEGSAAEPPERRCDFLFFSAAGDSEALRFAPIELKAGRPNAFEVRDQLQAGTDIGNRLLPQGAAVRFQPVLGYGRPSGKSSDAGCGNSESGFGDAGRPRDGFAAANRSPTPSNPRALIPVPDRTPRQRLQDPRLAAVSQTPQEAEGARGWRGSSLRQAWTRMFVSSAINPDPPSDPAGHPGRQVSRRGQAPPLRPPAKAVTGPRAAAGQVAAKRPFHHRPQGSALRHRLLLRPAKRLVVQLNRGAHHT